MVSGVSLLGSTRQKDQSTDTFGVASIIVIIAFLLFLFLGGQSEPSCTSASQEIADLEMKYRNLFSSHKEVLKELAELQKNASQPDSKKELAAQQQKTSQPDPTEGHASGFTQRVRGLARQLTALGSGFGHKTKSTQPDPKELEQTVKAIISKIYEENLGRVDWLLDLNGAHIEDSSATLDVCLGMEFVQQMACYAKFGMTARPVQSKPSTILTAGWSSRDWSTDDAGAMLGKCWAMNGTSGYATISLGEVVLPEKVVLQHVPPSVTLNQGRSAPRRFRILGWLQVKGTPQDEEVSERVLVEGEYQLSELSVGTGDVLKHIQHFPVPEQSKSPINRVRLEVLSNHGEEYTCLYHMRLYGTRSE